MNEIIEWFEKNLPADLFDGTPDVRVDREEVTVIGSLPAAADGDVAAYREETRQARMEVASRAQEIFGRKVSWGVRSDEQDVLFTHVAVPFMTRLRQPERQVLDTLVSAGVARSRADALAWCVRLVGRHEADWIARMQDALGAVHDAR
ncbi:MAG: hypothetical protein WAW88_09235, partial [Nocardioides sp.]